MIEDKNIDRLFQEKLKDMEVAPDPKVWLAIEDKLQNKKRRVLPIWWFSSGVAATLVLGLILFSNEFKKDKKEDNVPVITEQNVKNKTKLKNNKEDNKSISIENEIVIKEEKNKFKNDSKKVLKKGNEGIIIASKNKRLLISNEKDKKVKNSEKNIVKGIVNSDKIADKNNLNHQSKSKRNEVVLKDFTLIDGKIAEKEKAKRSEEVIVKGTSSDNIALNKKSNLLEKQENKKDFIAEINKTKEVKKEESKQDKKWAISPVFGVLQSNSFTEASALDATLNSNSVSGENSYSYGVDLVYKLNSNWSIKSGIQLQKTAFVTKDITFTSSAIIVASGLDNVQYTSSNGGASSSDFDQLNSGNELELDLEQGDIQQSYGYLEIPLEIKYTFFKSNTLKTSLISGFSSLFLTENTIVGESANFGGNIGEANNLNSINFSGNLGIDVDFMLTKRLNLNINPMFKTQLNTFSKNSNGFKPYILGVYTGIRYEF